MTGGKLVEVAKSFFVDPDYEQMLSRLGLGSIEAVFSFDGGEDLQKETLQRYRRRIRFEAEGGTGVFFLKRYDRPPIFSQLKNWFCHGRRGSFAFFDFYPGGELAEQGIATARTVAFGEQRGRFFEKRSFVITEAIAAAQSLERRLPAYLSQRRGGDDFERRRHFIEELAGIVKRFHRTGYRHRDLYFSHIFYGQAVGFCLIDLARAFKPRWFGERFRVKDIAQLYYSAPKRYFSRTDRLRFYFALAGRRKLGWVDKRFIRRVKRKAERMAGHDARHGRAAPFSR